MRIDHLVVVGMATLQLGAILESDAVHSPCAMTATRP